MRRNQFRRHVLPLSALMTAGALVLSTAPDATAAQAAATSGPSLNEHPVAGEVAATATVTDTEAARKTEKATVIVTRRLTSKVRASGRATGHATRTSRATATVKVVRYAPTYKAALAEAHLVAATAAHNRALIAARSRAAKLALTGARAAARSKARYRADVNVRRRFGALAVSGARAQRGKPYRWGATGPRAFDCSGLVGYVMRGLGVRLPRTAAAMSRKSHHLAKSHKQPGDLIFFGGRHVHHVGIYAGHGMIWHTPGRGRSVQKVRIWTSSYAVGRVA